MSDTQHNVKFEDTSYVPKGSKISVPGVTAKCDCGDWNSKPYDNEAAAKEIGDTHVAAMVALNKAPAR